MMKIPIEALLFGVMKISSRSTDQKKMCAQKVIFNLIFASPSMDDFNIAPKI